MSQVIILGSKGMLGQELVLGFKKFGYDTLGLDQEDIDITDSKDMESKLVPHKPRIIINAAAYNNVDKIEESPETYSLARNVNAKAVGNLASLCRKINTIFIHYSSDYVFKGDNQSGYSEGSVIDPINKYGETKAEGEKLLMENGDKYYLIRLSRLFGKPATGTDAKKSFVDNIIALAKEGKKTSLDLVDEEYSCPTYAPDLADFTRELLESSRPYGIYHGANSGACTWYEFGKKALELKKIKIDLNPVSGDKFARPAKRPAFSELLNTRLLAQRRWESALEEYLFG